MSVKETIAYKQDERPTLMDWMIKHNVSLQKCNSSVAVSRALESN